jgi:hypothetical protein
MDARQNDRQILVQMPIAIAEAAAQKDRMVQQRAIAIARSLRVYWCV